jgi:ATP-dependent DNA ligase
MPGKVLADLRRQLEPLARNGSALTAPPARETRFGSPLVLSQVHWVEPRLVTEITYLSWTADGLLRRTRHAAWQNDVAVDLAGPTHLGQPIDQLVVEPDPNHAVGTRARCRIGHP